MFWVTLPTGRTITPALIVVDMQNGFLLARVVCTIRIGMNTPNYERLFQNLRFDRILAVSIPIFYTEALKEASGIDMLTRIHNFLPKSRQGKLKVPICIRSTWDGVTIDELKPKEYDPVVIKRRDSAFQDTEFRVWLQSEGINLLYFWNRYFNLCRDFLKGRL